MDGGDGGRSAGVVEADDADVLKRLSPPVRRWWIQRFGEFVPENGGYFTPPQREAIPLIAADTNTLICAPTGSGKTLAAFTAIVDELFQRGVRAGLENTVYCLYVSPLKSLANDIRRNLEAPLAEITAEEDVEIRQAIRHGDTDAAARQRMLEETPHVLNTTPETLAILLNSPAFREKLRTVEYVIVDEIHSLAGDKRGTHLAVSLERLETLVETSPTRIGCSATIEPLPRVAEFLVGRESPRGDPRDVEVVDARFDRELDVELVSPVEDLVGTSNHAVRDRFYDRLESWLRDHDTTLVFTNTRSGAERVLHRLRERYGYDETNSGCHHGSLSTAAREAVEGKLKAGVLDVVTTSTSLELGIDMPTLDLVVQVGSPKSIASLLQRVGRAGHRPGDTVKGRIVAMDRDELIECAVMLERAVSGEVDEVRIPERAQDVAAQHVYGMAINAVRPEREALETLRRAYPYRDYRDDEWESLLEYLTADYPDLADRNVYPKIWRDENDPPGGEHHHEDFPVGEPLIGKRGRLARPIYLTNVGTIPDSFSCDVLTRGEKEWVGELDEAYLDTVETGDVFVLGGGTYEYRYRRGRKVYVEPTDGRPTVPSWFSERKPRTLDVGRAVLRFQGTLVDRHSRGGLSAVREWLRDLPLSETAVYALAKTFDEQVRYAGRESVSRPGRLVVEEERDREDYRRRYYVHSQHGRRFNDGLSRLLAYHVARSETADVRVAVADNGLVLSMPLNRKVDVASLLSGIDRSAVRRDLRASLRGTDLLERYFRINATRSLLVLRNYKGHRKSAGRQQVDAEMLLGYVSELDGFAVLEETYRELFEERLAAGAIEAVVGAIGDGEVELHSHVVDSPSPLAFGLATLSTSEVVLVEGEDAAMETYHERVVESIADE